MRFAAKNGFWSVALVALAACVDATSPGDVTDHRGVFSLAAAPRFSVQPSASAVADLTRARAKVTDAGTGEVLASKEQDIDPSASEWTIDLSFSFTATSPPRVLIEAELASVNAGIESVEFSGRTQAFLVQRAVGTQVREVGIFRGPLANLGLTGLTVAQAPASLREGATAQLRVSLQGETTGTRVYYDALDPTVAVIDADGVVRALAPGAARVVALAGRVADTVSLTVEAVVLPSPETLSATVSPQLDYTAAEVAGTLEDRAGAADISNRLTDLAVALASRSGSAAVAAFERAVVAWRAYGEGTTLRTLDGPQLGLVELTLIHVADALGVPFG